MGHFGKQFTSQFGILPSFFMTKPIAKESIYIFVNLAVIFFSHNTKWVSGGYPLGIVSKKSQKIAQFKAMSSPCGWVLWELGPHSALPQWCNRASSCLIITCYEIKFLFFILWWIWIFEFEIILHDLHNENDKDKGLVVWLFEGIFHFFTFLNLVLNFSIPNFQFVFTQTLG